MQTGWPNGWVTHNPDEFSFYNILSHLNGLGGWKYETKEKFNFHNFSCANIADSTQTTFESNVSYYITLKNIQHVNRNVLKLVIFQRNIYFIGTIRFH